MSAVPIPEPQDFEPSELPAEVADALNVEDLVNRTDKAYAEHAEGYTASNVLHKLWMDGDEGLRSALDLIFERLDAYHAETYTAWRASYNHWAMAAGVEPFPDGTEQAMNSDRLKVYDDIEALFADVEDAFTSDPDTDS